MEYIVRFVSFTSDLLASKLFNVYFTDLGDLRRCKPYQKLYFSLIERMEIEYAFWFLLSFLFNQE